MTYFTEDLDDVGVYSLRVMIGLDSEVGNTAYADFKLTIQEPQERTSPNRIQEPRAARLELQDQTIPIGGNLLYPIGEFESLWGDPMDVRVDLGLAADFLQFDTTTNSFTVATDSIDL